MADIFKFWSGLAPGTRIHPADEKTFKRMNAERHGFDLKCLAGSFAGKLRTAPVVLLYLSPGHSADTVSDAQTQEGQAYRHRAYTGDEPFRDYGPGKTWLASRTKLFGNYESVRQNVAILNIGAYHSKDVKSYSSLLALPSSRASLAWAQDTLFPEAEASKRIVICMRSAAYWGLDTGRKYNGTLFAPLVNRGGYLIKSGNEKLVDLVRSRLS